MTDNLSYLFEVPGNEPQLAAVIQHIIRYWGQHSTPGVEQTVPCELIRDKAAFATYQSVLEDGATSQLTKGAREHNLMVLGYRQPQWTDDFMRDVKIYRQEVLTIPALDLNRMYAARRLADTIAIHTGPMDALLKTLDHNKTAVAEQPTKVHPWQMET